MNGIIEGIKYKETAEFFTLSVGLQDLDYALPKVVTYHLCWGRPSTRKTPRTVGFPR